MAQNVNIIGKDSEGNPRALKINSEGNLEISDSSGWGESLQGISDKLDILVDKLESGDQKVQLSGTNALFESEVYQREGSIAANTTETFVDINNRPCVLESLAVGTDYLNMGISVRPYKFDGTLGQRLGLPFKDGTSSSIVLPGALQTNWNGESDLFKSFIHDTSEQNYSIGMKRQAKFNSGVRVSIVNYDSSNPRNVSVVCLVSKWGVA